jgi:hypothetical protein
MKCWCATGQQLPSILVAVNGHMVGEDVIPLTGLLHTTYPEGSRVIEETSSNVVERGCICLASTPRVRNVRIHVPHGKIAAYEPRFTHGARDYFHPAKLLRFYCT